MTTTDTELFELCKQVYESTEWYPPYADTTHHLPVVPLYTSDYLLEKLPNEIKGIGIDIDFADEGGGWCASYDYMAHATAYADTPLKALLKLTLALAKEELLK